MDYEEIILKYVEGRIIPSFDWLLKQLEDDPEVKASSNRQKENLRKFLQAQVDSLDEYLQGGGDDDRDTQDDTEIFGDEDIVVSPDTDITSEGTDEFLDPDPDDEEDDEMPGW